MIAESSQHTKPGVETAEKKSPNAHFMKPEGPHRIKNLSNVRILAFRVEFKQAE